MSIAPDIVAAFAGHVSRAMAECGVPKGAHVGVALSGGADSVALLRALVDADYRVTALHCNFSLRGTESDGDEAFCRDLCRSLGVDLEVVTFDTLLLREQGESVEMACRRLRYEWFHERYNALSLSAIAIAHHREDSHETMLINLLRGTGPVGLRGLASRREIYVRPMLGLTRDDIESYLDALHQDYRIDSSNLTNDYRRNALRNSVLPIIAQSFPEYQSGLDNTADAMVHASALIGDFIDIARERFVEGDAINVGRLKQVVKDPFATLYLLIPRFWGVKMGKRQVADIVAVDVPETRCFTSEDGQSFELHRGILRRAVVSPEEEVKFGILSGLETPIVIKSREISVAEFRVMDKPKDASAIFLDASCFNASSEAILRPWRDGDRLKPYGMKGSRKLSDIFSDLHLSASQKRQVRVVEVGGEIIWMPGIRASRLFPVTERTESVVMLSID